MIVSMIVAMAKNRVIGANNQLPWHLPEDLKRFRQITMGHAIVMGRKTHESIARILPGRENLVVSRNADYEVKPGAHLFSSVETALAWCEAHGVPEVFIIGGAEIYRYALPLVTRIYLTRLREEYRGDAILAEFESQFKCTLSEQSVLCDYELWTRE